MKRGGPHGGDHQGGAAEGGASRERALEGVLHWAREDHRPERQRFALRQSRVDAACSLVPPEVLE